MKHLVPIIVILLLVSTSFVGLANQSENGNIITVDNEGDGDYTLIKQALNNANPGDTIEVYSGIYREEGIRITKENVSLIGISHELGEGDDSGKPFIQGNGTETIVQVEASYVTVSNLKIENPCVSLSYNIWVGTDWINKIHNITIRDCIISNSSNLGISINQPGTIWNITIINNHISHCRGISFIGNAVPADQMSCIISGNVITNSPGWGISFHGVRCIISKNVITDCRGIGIELRSNFNNISGNIIRQCGVGIEFTGVNNIIYRNDIGSCPVGIQYYGLANIFKKNNFKNYSRTGFWFSRWFGEQFLLRLKSRWIGNYWDTWIGVGPKIILGLQAISYASVIPGFEFDWHPAKEPYDI